MKRRFSKQYLLCNLQRVLVTSLAFLFLLKPRKQKGVVIGFSETCGLVAQTGLLVEGSQTICFENDYFFNTLPYDFRLKPGIFYKLRRFFFGAWILVNIAHTKSTVIYIGWDKLLIDTLDFGQFEFEFLKKRGVAIVFWFTGSDIRSLARVRELHTGDKSENWADIMPIAFPKLDSQTFEFSQKVKAQVAERYANIIINNERDQTSYLSRTDSDTFPITDPVFFDASLVRFSPGNYEIVQVLHAPSSPLIKGTPLVHAAIKRLINEGYAINYIEARNSTREEMRQLISKSHIVLNQFYSKTPGHFGFEAMAGSCILLQSAELPIDNLLRDFEETPPWVRCSTFEIYDCLKEVLDDIPRFTSVAISGYNYALREAHPDAVRPKINALLKQIQN